MISEHRSGIIKLLLDVGADPKEVTKSNDNPCGHRRPNIKVWEAYLVALKELDHSTEEGIIEMLLEKGADPNVGGHDQGFFSFYL